MSESDNSEGDIEEVYAAMSPPYRLICRYLDSQTHKGDVPRANAAASVDCDGAADAAAQTQGQRPHSVPAPAFKGSQKAGANAAPKEVV